ncbi:MAG TPA: BON domain-containing protein [Blastocatellia bacterium]|jgi:type II secretory pathway pseudopilin PulG|nr:BON domain-containing protein [Blastocatellia bacterium]
MAEYEERRTVIEDIPVGRRPVVETQYDSVVHERRGLSGAAIAALVIAAIAAAVLITMMIVNSNQRSREAQLEMERDRARAAAAQAGSQPTQSQPQVVVVPPSQSQPTTVPVPVPVPVPGASSPAPSTGSTPAVSDASIEIDVTTKLLDDQELRTHPIDVKFADGTATLSGNVPSEEIKARAEKVAKAVKGVRRVVNNLAVSNQ